MQNLQDHQHHDEDVDLTATSQNDDNDDDDQNHFKNVKTAAALFVKSSFTSCDQPLLDGNNKNDENLSSRILIPSSSTSINTTNQKKFRGEAILKPKLDLSLLLTDKNNQQQQQQQQKSLITSPSVFFPNECSFVRFHSAAATMPKSPNEEKQQQQQRNQEVLVRHERLFKHPVSTGCFIQSGCQVKFNNNNKKVTTTTKAVTGELHVKAKNNNNYYWNLYWGGRWREENLFKKELTTSIPSELGCSRINHFPGTQQLGRKDYLAIALQKMKIRFPLDYANVFPQTFILPRDNAIFVSELKKNHQTQQNQQNNSHSNNFFIAKPPASSQGRGVFMFEANSSASLPIEVTKAMNSPVINNNNNNNNSSTSTATVSSSKKKKTKTVVTKKSSSSTTTAVDEDEGDDTEDDENADDDDDDNSSDQTILVQKYIPNPLTINGYKVDLRVYACVTSYEPLKIFVFNDGLVRFASVPFSRPHEDKEKNNQNLFAHLTNVSVNVQNESKKYQQTDSADQDGTEEGSKWTIQALKKFVINGEWSRQQQQQQKQQKGQRETTTTTTKTDDDGDTNNDKKIWNNCWKTVCNTITKVLISVQEEISSKVSSLIGKRNSCFELYGFDILLDDSLRNAYVLEVNILPSLVCNSALDRHIKGHMIADMLDLAGVGLIHKNDKNTNTNSEENNDHEGTSSQAAAAAVSSSLTIMLQGPILSSAAISKLMMMAASTTQNPSSSTTTSKTSPEEELQKKLSSMISAGATKTVVTTAKKSESSAASSVDASSSSSKMIKNLMSCVVTDADRGIISYAEEELHRRGGWDRVFPTTESISEMKHLFSSSSSTSTSSTTRSSNSNTTGNKEVNNSLHASNNNIKRGNKILWAWEIAKSRYYAGEQQTLLEEAEIISWLRGENNNKNKKPVAKTSQQPPKVVADETPVITKRAPSVPQKRKSVVTGTLPRVATMSSRGKTVAAVVEKVQPVTSVETTQVPCQVFSFQSIPK